MTRRDLIKRVCGGVIGLCAVTHIPIEWVPTPIKTEGALIYLVKAWQQWVKGNPFRPFTLYSGSELFHQFESELQLHQRFTSHESGELGEPTLLFKSGLYRIDETMKGWDVRFEYDQTH